MANGLQVAEVAAILNVVFILVKISYPLLITLIAVSTIKANPNAATWSVFGRLVNESHWRTALRTDTASRAKVAKSTRALSGLSTILGALLAVAAAITPLGLHETLRLRKSDAISFRYVQDTSSIGQATLLHDSYSENRLCGYYLAQPCPGISDGYTYIHNASGWYGVETPGETQQDWISTAVPSNVTETFTSATSHSSSTIASLFDIQFRTFINYNNATKPEAGRQWLDEGKPRTEGRFRYSQSFIIESDIRAVEGLLVSTADSFGPGIGFRNHTLPFSRSQYGCEWSEDVLWLEPVTECTDLNITYDYATPAPNSFTSVQNGRITDRGGLANMVRDYPYLDLNDTQTNSMIRDKSWKAAVLTNNFLLQLLNESRHSTRLGKAYLFENLNLSILGIGTDPRQIAFSQYGYQDDDPLYIDPSLPGPLVDHRTMQNISDYDGVIHLDDLISFSANDKVGANISGARGGLILGMAMLVDSDGQPNPDNGLNGRLDPGTNWSQPIYSCVSAVKASVKNVRFQLNGSETLTNLKVIAVSPANFTPTWGLEDPGLPMGHISPYWRIVSDTQKNRSDFATLRKPELYLPAGTASVMPMVFNTEDASASTSAPWSVLDTIYPSTFMDSLDLPEFSGKANWPLAQKRVNLTANASVAGRVIDLIWTDDMANYVIGAKSVLSRAGVGDATEVMMPAEYYERSVGYDWKYAIPALVFLALYTASLVASVALGLARQTTLNTVRNALNQSSAGRAMTTERFQERHDAIDSAATKEWAIVRGDEVVDLLPDTILACQKGKYGQVHQVDVEEHPAESSHTEVETHHFEQTASEGQQHTEQQTAGQQGDRPLAPENHVSSPSG